MSPHHPKLLHPVLFSLILALGVLSLAACEGADRRGDADSGTSPGTDSGMPTADDGGGPNPPIPDGAVPPPPDCSPTVGGPRDGYPGGGELALIFGSRDETGFHAWEEGSTVPFVWGFQGGTMIMPVLRVESSGLEGDPVCVHSQILNAFTDEGLPIDVPEFLQDVEVHLRDDAYETDPLFDQLSYDSPEGRALSLEGTISLSGFTVTGAVNVLVGPEGDMPLPGG